MLDFDTSAEVSGKGFYYLKGDLALLNMALINFARDFMVNLLLLVQIRKVCSGMEKLPRK